MRVLQVRWVPEMDHKPGQDAQSSPSDAPSRGVVELVGRKGELGIDKYSFGSRGLYCLARKRTLAIFLPLLIPSFSFPPVFW